MLIRKSLNPNAVDIDGNSSLHIACQYRNSDIIDFILSLHNCDVNAINAIGNTPLHLACQNGSISIAMKLMTTGEMDYKIENNDGLTAMEVATDGGQVRETLSSCIQKIEVPFTPIRRVYLLGSNSSGKSTAMFKRNQGIVPIFFSTTEANLSIHSLQISRQS